MAGYLEQSDLISYTQVFKSVSHLALEKENITKTNRLILTKIEKEDKNDF